MFLYVIQVAGGKEAQVEEMIARYVAPGLVRECFIPRYEAMRRWRGQWHKRNELLVPGYLFVDTADAAALASELRSVPAFTKLLGNDERFIPLEPDEAAWLGAFTSVGNRVVEMSSGVMEGDEVVVLNGPLMGHEASIAKIDRHRRHAYLTVRICGREKQIKVGLEIVAKRTSTSE